MKRDGRHYGNFQGRTAPPGLGGICWPWCPHATIWALPMFSKCSKICSNCSKIYSNSSKICSKRSQIWLERSQICSKCSKICTKSSKFGAYFWRFCMVAPQVSWQNFNFRVKIIYRVKILFIVSNFYLSWQNFYLSWQNFNLSWQNFNLTWQNFYFIYEVGNWTYSDTGVVFDGMVVLCCIDE